MSNREGDKNYLRLHYQQNYYGRTLQSEILIFKIQNNNPLTFDKLSFKEIISGFDTRASWSKRQKFVSTFVLLL